ncbi:hypothetical protein Cha6605_3225 [Chamaesiphon minutus PCC 6605]|uniref:Uncharacterized protein n=1 Tax=Chamaesiphon minutus (strain ATCC 27169 / PCC 6605) TaxID=1173020 RepID=K9UHF5_CHAP6|nr:hypothetical protein Cha6605_3225 [Chamaesiphon minutus PCC 6605]
MSPVPETDRQLSLTEIRSKDLAIIGAKSIGRCMVLMVQF